MAMRWMFESNEEKESEEDEKEEKRRGEREQSEGQEEKEREARKRRYFWTQEFFQKFRIQHQQECSNIKFNFINLYSLHTICYV